MKSVALALAAHVVGIAFGGVTVSLDGEWRLDYFPQPNSGAVRTLAIPERHVSLTAVVPGNCELDLQRTGLLPELTVGLNVLKLRPYECYQWLYTKTFEAPAVDVDAGEKAELIFGGIDTLADVFLNGEKIGESSNMFIERRFNVTKKLRAGKNTVQVLLRPVLLDAQFQTVGEMGGAVEPGGDGERYRKAAHMGGWDIMPRAYVQGLWRSVALAISEPVRILEPDWIVKKIDFKRNRAEIKFRSRVEAPFDVLDVSAVRVSLSRNGKLVVSQTAPLVGYHPMVDFAVEQPDLWWPRGFGEPALYDAKAEIVGKDGAVLAENTCRLGIRTIRLDREDVYHDKKRNGRFFFIVNGEKCFIRGSNWVPLDALHGRDSRHLRLTLEMFEDLNCNMLRVWGGSVYETDEFFDWCDEHGIMVWQDFMTACGAFPQDDEYARVTREEVVATVIRLRNHPSLALWSGNNENDLAMSWSVGPDIARDPNHDRTSRHTIPDVLYEYDLTRPYLPSSPYCGPDIVAKRAYVAENHLWGPREYYKAAYYTNAPSWFASETGYHGCPNRDSMEKMMTPDCVYTWTNVTGEDPKKDFHWNDEWLLKACNPTLVSGGLRHATRNNLMVNHCKILFGACPKKLDDFIWQSQFAQSEAMKTFIELFRSLKFQRKSGLIWWNMRDGWPILSDSVVDYYGGKKRAYYTIRNVQGDQLVCVTDDGKVHAVNDTLKPVHGSVRICDRDSGKVVLSGEYEVPPNSEKTIGRISWSGQGILDIRYEQGGEMRGNWFLYGEPPFDYVKMREWMSNSLRTEKEKAR